MNADRQADLLYEALKTEYTAYVDDVMKIVASLVIALGWLFTNETTRKALGHEDAKWVVFVFIAFIAVNITLVVLGHYLRSRRTYAALLALAPETRTIADNYVIVPAHVTVNSIALLSLLGLIASVVWSAH